MIILDTNVVSEPMRVDAAPAVRAWLNEQLVETLFLTTISLAELRVGLAVLPEGRRKTSLSKGLNDVLESLFAERVLAFDRDAADVLAGMWADARKSGWTVSFADAQIAAIARSQGFSVATRDVVPFEACGVSVINPWK